MGSFLSLQLYSIDVPACHCSNAVFICSAVLLEVQDSDSPSSFTVENSFSYPGFFFISNEFENCCILLCEELSWNFDGDCIESVDCFWQDSHFYFINPAHS